MPEMPIDSPDNLSDFVARDMTRYRRALRLHVYAPVCRDTPVWDARVAESFQSSVFSYQPACLTVACGR